MSYISHISHFGLRSCLNQFKVSAQTVAIRTHTSTVSGIVTHKLARTSAQLRRNFCELFVLLLNYGFVSWEVFILCREGTVVFAQSSTVAGISSMGMFIRTFYVCNSIIYIFIYTKTILQ